MLDRDEKLREAMVKAYAEGNYDEALKLSQQLDERIVEATKANINAKKEAKEAC